jgi:uncharacterized protein YbaP (TraB family)
MKLFWWKEKHLRTVWRVEREGRISHLVGTAHFCPYPFEHALAQLIKRAETVVFEGPLDEDSMARVVQYGRQGENAPSLYESLDPEAIREINAQLSARLTTQTSTVPYLDLFHKTTSDLVATHTHGVRPWLGFFTIWSALLGWKYSMDLEAFWIAQKLGKRIQYLETIEDQVAALDGIPFERFVNYLNHIARWKAYRAMFVKAFLGGDMEKFASMTGEFPTRCESILAKRDPVFFRGIKAFVEEGETTAFIGVVHLPGMKRRFFDEGYQVTQEET